MLTIVPTTKYSASHHCCYCEYCERFGSYNTGLCKNKDGLGLGGPVFLHTATVCKIHTLSNGGLKHDEVALPD